MNDFITNKNRSRAVNGGQIRGFLGMLLGLLFLCTNGLSAQLAPTITELQANATSADRQGNPVVAMDTSGNFVVVWESYGQDGSDYGIYFQIFDSVGNILVAEKKVNATTTAGQRFPDVAMAPNGNFAVVWNSELQDNNGHGCYRRGYDISGSTLTSESRLNSTTSGEQTFPVVAMDFEGNFTGVFMDIQGDTTYSIYRRRTNSSFSNLESPVLIRTQTNSFVGYPDVASDSVGNVIVVWQEADTDGDGMGVFAQLYDNNGDTDGSVFQVNSTTTGNQQAPSVGMDHDGNFVIAWTSYAQDGDGYGIYYQRYSSNGNTVGSETLVNSTTANDQVDPDVAMTGQGNFNITWTSYDQDGNRDGVYATSYLAEGNTYDADILINSRTTDFQQFGHAAWRDDSLSMIAVWQDGLRYSTSTHDGDDYGIFAQIFSSADTTPPTADCANITTYLDGAGSVTITPADVMGNSSDNVKITDTTISLSSFVCADTGIKVTTLTVQDAAGLSSSCNAAVFVFDSTSPTAVCQDITIFLDGAGSASLTGSDLDNGSSDNCGVNSYTASTTSFTCSETGANNVTLTLKDVSGNSSSCISVVTVQDSAGPTAVCQDLDVYLDAAGSATITAGDVDNGTTDNCVGTISFSLTQTSFTCAEIGANTETLTATDPGGNSATCTTVITVIDSVSPTAVCQNLSVYLDAAGSATITSGDIDGGSADNCSVGSLSLDISTFACANVGANTVTMTVSDTASNSNTCTSTVTVIDSISPTAVCQDLTVYLDAVGSATITAGDIDNGSSDVCGVSTTTISTPSFSCTEVGANTVTLTVEDVNLNASTCTSTVTVLDSVSPTAVCQNLSVYLGGTGSTTITTGDVDNGSSDNCGVSSLNLDSSTFTCTDVGSVTVTMTATDDNSNTSTCTSVVTVIDSTSPTAVCQDVTLYLDGAGSATVTASDADNGSSDACGIASTTITQSALTCTNVGTPITDVLTVTDANANVSTCTYTITVLDSILPTAVCQDLTVYLDGTGSASITAGDVDNGSSDACGVSSTTLSQSTYTCTDVGANTTTLTVEDANLNTSTCTSTVTIVDSTAPTAVCQNLSVYLGGTGSTTITTGDVDNGSSDNCGISSLNLDVSTFTCTDVGSVTVTMTATDDNSNTSTCTSVITVIDSTSPTAVCQDVTLYLDGAGSATVTASDADNGSSDACGIASTTITQSGLTCTNVGTPITDVLTVTDANTNVSTCTYVITVLDSTAPTAVCQDVTVHLDGTGSASITTGDIDNGSSDNCSIDTYTLSLSSFTCTEVGSNTVTLTTTDGSSNSSTCTSTVTVVDSTSPTAVCQDLTLFLDAAGSGSITTGDVDNGSSDNCGISGLTLDTSAFTCSDVGAVTVTLTATDDNSNTSTCTSVITVTDSTAPTAVCQNVTLYLDGTGNGTVTASDADNGSSDACGIASTAITLSGFTCTDVGTTITDVLTVTDANANVSTCTFAIFVVDSTTPTAVCQDVTVHLDGTGSASITTGDIDNGSSDNCGIDTLLLSVSSFTCTEVGTNTVTLTTTDESANSSTCTSTVTVVDSTSPTAVCQDLTLYLDAAGSGSITTGDVDAGSSDNCGIDTLDLNTSAFTCSDVGAVTVTLTATDDNGNTSTCTSVVTVTDSTAPTAVCQDVTLYLDGTGNATVTAADADNGSSDACSIASTTITQSALTCTDIGTPITDVLTVTDANANVSTCTYVITVLDSTVPTAICQDVTVYLDGIGAATITTTDIDNGSADNCGIDTLTLSVSSFTCTEVGSNTVTLTAADETTNSSTCTSTVTVVDSTAPTAACQNLNLYLDASGNGSITTGDIDAGSSDNCGIDSLSLSVSTFTCTDVGAVTVILTATDDNSNTSTCTSTVTVIDSIAPTAVCQNVTVYLDGTGSGTVAASDVDAGSSDACSIAMSVINSTTFACADVGTTVADTLTVIDANSNGSTCAFNIAIEDTTAPTAVCQDITVQLSALGTGSLTAADVDGGSTDNCSVDSSMVSTTSFACADVGANTVTLTLMDATGNTSTCTSTVTVEDNIAPTATCVDITVQLDAVGSATIVGSDLDGGSTDACGIQTYGASQLTFACSDVGTVSDTLTVTDVNGNGSTCVATVTVSDTISPAAVCQDITVYLDAAGMGSITASDADGGSTDACGVATLNVSNAMFNCSQVGTSFGDTLTVTDVNGNSSFCTFSLDVADTLAPTAVCQDITVYLNNAGTRALSPIMIEGGSTDNCMLTMPTISDTLFTCVDTGANSVTLTHTDVNGNVGSCVATVTVLDTLSPMAICQDVTTYLDALGSATILSTDLDNGSADNCTVASVSAAMTTFSCTNVGPNPVVLTVTDVSGNTSTCTSIVSVLDTLLPTAVCVDDTIYLDNTGQAIADANVIGMNSTDNCSVDSLKLDVSDFDCADIGTKAVTLSILDPSNNGDSCSATITVLDTIAPVISCQDYTLYLDSAGTGNITPANVTTGPPTDNCGGIGMVMLSQNNFVTADTGLNAITVSVMDSSGNLASCIATVTVVDSFFVGMEEELVAYGFSFTAYPNPTNGDLFVEIVCENCTPGEPTQIMLTSMLGEVLYRKEVELIGGRVKEQLDMRSLAQGAYVLSVQQGGKTVNRRIVRY